MFAQLIESGSHAREFKRRGYFLLGTLVFYGTLLAAAGVGSVYAYNASLDEENLEVLALLRFAPQAPAIPAEPKRREQTRPAAPTRSAVQPRPLQRTELSYVTPNLANRAVANSTTPDAPPREIVQLGDTNFTPTELGNSLPGVRGAHLGGPGSGPAGPRVNPADEGDAPEMTTKTRPTPVAEPPRAPRRPQSLGVINGRASHLPQPAYSPIARAARAQGAVTVQVLVDEAGRVVSAQASDGHPLLRPLAVQAALRARFTPTLLSQQPVKVSGLITYNFVLQ